MTSTSQAPGSTVDQDAPDRLPIDAVLAHGDDMTRAVSTALSLATDLELDLGPTEPQDGPSDLAPAGGAHGVMVSLGGGHVVQVAVILDDALKDRVAGPNPPEPEPGAAPAWLGVVSNAVDGWARSQGAVVSGALPIERAAQLDHLLVIDGQLTLVAAGLFHEGRHAGTVALVARASDDASSNDASSNDAAAADPSVAGSSGAGSSTAAGDALVGGRTVGGGAGASDAVTTAAAAAVAGLSAPVVEEQDPSANAEPPRAAALRALAEVEMLVTVELGRTRMAVADLLDLGPGSVIELDRTAGSPIDLLVNGTLIARGEVVVIDEEYGIRLTEIVGSGEV